MKRKLLAILAVFGILVMLAIPFATPVFAASPTITSVNPPDGDGPHGHPGQTLHDVLIFGTDFSNPSNTNNITFSNPNITINNITYLGVTTLRADISISGDATPATTTISITNLNGSGGPFSGLFQIINHVPQYPSPVGASTNAVSVAITAFRGGVPINGQVQVGDVINYQVALAMPQLQSGALGFNFFGGTMAVRLPSSNTTYFHAAGFGSASPAASNLIPGGSTPWMPIVPEITKNDVMILTLPFSYTVSASDQVMNGGVMRLMAYVDYGIPDFPAGNGGVSGTFEDGFNGATVGAHAGAVNGLIIATPGPPVPELPAGALFGLGLFGLGGFIIFKKYRQAAAAR